MASAEPSVAALPPAAEVEPRRRLSGLLSVGHVTMVVTALVAAVLNYSVLRAHDEAVRVAVAAHAIPAGAPVTADALRFTDARVDDDVLATMLDPERAAGVDGWIATGPIAAGELVRASDLRSPSAPQAQRAMSLPIDPEHAVAGALRAGDRVDVIEVRDDVATYLLTDAEVLAVPASQPRGGLGALSHFSVTLAVDDDTALRLAVGLRSGALEVVRSTGSRAVRQDNAEAAGEPAASGPESSSQPETP